MGNRHTGPSTAAGETFLTLQEVADLLGLKPTAVRNARSNGTFPPAVRIAGRLMWPRSVIDQFLRNEIAADATRMAARREQRAQRGAERRGRVADEASPLAGLWSAPAPPSTRASSMPRRDKGWGTHAHRTRR